LGNEERVVIGKLPQLISDHASAQGRSLTAGVVVGVVTGHAKDPDGLGRVKVRFPWLTDRDESFWARVAAPMAGNDRGAYFLPEIDDEVLVMFAHGDVRFPYVIGSLWNGKDKPPASNADGENNLRMIKSRSGHVIKLDDTKDSETVEIIDKTGKNRVVIDTKTNSITITADKDIVLAAPNGEIRLTAKTIAIGSSESGEVTAGTTMTVQAEADLTVLGKTVNIN
jgi:uncharacterized protein involved in type VI secretion and phage assembly